MVTYRIILAVSFAILFFLASLARGDDVGAKAMFYGADTNIVVVPTPKPSTKPASRPISRPRAKQLAIKSWVKLVDQTGGVSDVSPSRNFKSGERIHLNFETNKAGYLYVANIGTSGNVTMLFPRSGQQNLVKPDLLYEVPDSAGKAIRFDNTPGVEEVLVVLSSEPLDTLKLDDGSEVPISNPRGGAPEPVRSVDSHRMAQLAAEQEGAKDLLIEDDPNATFATYRPAESMGEKSVKPKPIVLKLKLKHGP